MGSRGLHVRVSAVAGPLHWEQIEGFSGKLISAMQEAIDQFDLPEMGCLLVTTGAVEREYRAPPI